MAREANAEIELGMLNAAEKKLERAVKLNPKETDIRRHYAEVLWLQGKHRESIDQLVSATKIGIQEGQEDGLVGISLAEKLLLENQIDGANRIAKKALESAPKEFKSWALHAKIQVVLGKMESFEGRRDSADRYFQRASSDYYRAIALAPQDSEQTRILLAELAELQMQLQQPERALSIWQNLERHYQPNPQPTVYLLGKAKTLLALKRLDDAIELFQLAIAKRPEDSELYVHLAEVQLQNGLIPEAGRTIEQLSRVNPDHPDVPRLVHFMNSVQPSTRIR